MNKSIMLMAVAGAMAGASPAVADTVVNVSAFDANTPDNVPMPVTQTFGPGEYTVSVVGKAGGGLYDAWSPATPSAGNWENRYTIAYGSTTDAVNPYNGQRFATPADALAAFSNVLTTFTLATPTAVTFSIPDYLWWDNSGGVSLNVAPVPVPEPATIGLFGLAGAMLLFARHRKRNAAAA